MQLYGYTLIRCRDGAKGAFQAKCSLTHFRELLALMVLRFRNLLVMMRRWKDVSPPRPESVQTIFNLSCQCGGVAGMTRYKNSAETSIGVLLFKVVRGSPFLLFHTQVHMHHDCVMVVLVHR